jgi:Holliday junction resolvasome RuvABC endonuclease subunit
MNDVSIKEPVVLAVYFNTWGFGYALFEGIMSPVDWGMKTPATRTEAANVQQVRCLLDRFEPSIVVMQHCHGPFMHCSERVKRQVAKIMALAKRKGMGVWCYSRTDVRNCFAYYGSVNKDEIARAIAERLPEFQSRVPPLRSPWMKEDYHMGMFDAVALATTYYWNERLHKKW